MEMGPRLVGGNSDSESTSFVRESVLPSLFGFWLLPFVFARLPQHMKKDRKHIERCFIVVPIFEPSLQPLDSGFVAFLPHLFVSPHLLWPARLS